MSTTYVCLVSLGLCTLLSACVRPDALSSDEGLPPADTTRAPDAGKRRDASQAATREPGDERDVGVTVDNDESTARPPSEGDDEKGDDENEAGANEDDENEEASSESEPTSETTDTSHDAGTPARPADAAAALPRTEVRGSARGAGCVMSTPQAADHCGGYYCGVSEQALAAELDTPICKPPDVPLETFAAEACEGAIPKLGARCSKEAVIDDPLASDEEIVRKIRACFVSDNARYETMPEDCVRCFLDMTNCTLSACFLECPANINSADCQACLIDNCLETNWECLQLPNPF